MCNQLISILNPSRSFDPVLDRSHLFVPCNKCSSCVQQKQNDIYIRLCSEYDDCVNNGGIVYFPTLTYDDNYLPFYFDASEYTDLHFWNGIGYTEKHNVWHQSSGFLRGDTVRDWIKPYYVRHNQNDFDLKWSNEHVSFLCPCFLNEDIKKFRDKMRVYISRGFVLHNGTRYYIPKDLTFRYSAFPQYGSKRTKRSHWHLLLFFNKQISLQCIEALIQHSWIYGKFSWSKKYGAVVNSKINSIKYVSRYASKDMASFDTHGLTNYLNNSEHKEQFRPYQPRNLNSPLMGASLLEKFKSNGTYDIKQIPDKIFVKGDDYGYSVPSYYLRKMFYDVHLDEQFPKYEQRKDGSLRNTRYLAELNDLGKQYKLATITRRINSTIRELEQYQSSLWLSSSFSDKPWNFQAISDKLKNLRGQWSNADVAVYEHIYRHKVCPSSYFSSLDPGVLTDNFFEYFDYSVYSDRLLRPDPVKHCQPYLLRLDNKFNQLQFYENFDIMLSLVADMRKQLGKQKTDNYLAKRSHLIKIRKQHNESLYD